MHQTFSQHSVGVTSEAETRVLAYHFGGLHVSNFDFCGKIYIQEVICVKDLGVVCLQCLQCNLDGCLFYCYENETVSVLPDTQRPLKRHQT